MGDKQGPSRTYVATLYILCNSLVFALLGALEVLGVEIQRNCNNFCNKFL